MSVNPQDAAFVRELVQKRSAITIDVAKDYLISMRLTQAARDNGFASILDLVEKARQGDKAANTSIIEAITTHETSFFRDLQPFETLTKVILPKFIAAGAPVRPINIWCGACSSGQEPYSIAMLMLEKFPTLAAQSVRIVATDLSAQVLAKASKGEFSQLEINRGLPAAMLVKYFDRHGMSWQVKPAVKRLVEFRQLNLIDPWVISPKPDIVFLRNVLIYFELQTRRTILDRVRSQLAPGGALFLGAAESTLNVAEGWERIVIEKYTYYKVQT